MIYHRNYNYLKWMKAVIEFRKQQENVDETNNN